MKHFKFNVVVQWIWNNLPKAAQDYTEYGKNREEEKKSQRKQKPERALSSKLSRRTCFSNGETSHSQCGSAQPHVTTGFPKATER